ncbi:unnamed protein product [Prorocentrum cordatum]|uniref:Phospholipase B-like n=1 Tax=Prorocentrum cordatum TaxID=2364126 RepID=A0ABN9U1H5_9DINO|nr:unnamed protein product [Polarella glacialis]
MVWNTSFRLGSGAAAAAEVLPTTAVADDMHKGNYPRDYNNKSYAVNAEFDRYVRTYSSVYTAPIPPTAWTSDAPGDSTDEVKAFLASSTPSIARSLDFYNDIYNIHHYFLDYDLIHLWSGRRE